VSVSAPVGGGKSTLTRALAARLPGASALHFDHYEKLTEGALQDIKRWMGAGADVDELVIEGLAEDLARLKRGMPVIDPAGLQIDPADYIVFETPFARLHRASGEHIDMAIWIDTPLDVALARNLREFLRRPEMRDSLPGWLGPYLDSYLDFVRELLVMQQQMVGGAADLVLDGMRDVDANLAVAEREIRARLR